MSCGPGSIHCLCPIDTNPYPSDRRSNELLQTRAPNMVSSTAAQIFLLLTAIAVILQLALVLGMPWGHLAVGGKHAGRFPLRMRIAAASQLVILLVLAIVVLTRAGMMLPGWLLLSKWVIWLVVAFCGVSVVLNLITPSNGNASFGHRSPS